jgi:hypothetical protein
MKNLINFLQSRFGTNQDAAAFLGYLVRQYFSIRKKIERGEALHPRVESHLRYKALLLNHQPFNKESLP